MLEIFLWFAGVALVFCIARQIKSDRGAIFLQATGIMVFFNGLTCHFPTHMGRFGYGFPFKWLYDPAFKYTGRGNDLHEVLPQRFWVFDAPMLLYDLSIAVVVVGVALVLNEWWQISQGNRGQSLNVLKTVEKISGFSPNKLEHYDGRRRKP